MKQNHKNHTHTSGFTLVEVMLAATLSAIVMISIGGLLVGYWKTARNFIEEEQTMQEISLLSRLFRDNARTLPSSINAGLDPSKITFVNGTSIRYENDSVIYHNGTTDGVFLEHSVVSYMAPSITNGTLIKLDVNLEEKEYDKVNKYQIYVMPRNG